MKTEHGIIGIMCALFWAPRLSGRFITNEHGECSCQYELSGIIMNFGNSPLTVPVPCIQHRLLQPLEPFISGKPLWIK